VQTAQANDLEPWAYLKQVFTELPQATTLAQIEALLPWQAAPKRLEGLAHGD
ncbi:MAG: transposase domain-containing protein, partial [Candidatus Competibacteraceae bacterium]|nr:transposase domain-containing protein [Candidatus Competibacteraceae bacterium]